MCSCVFVFARTELDCVHYSIICVFFLIWQFFLGISTSYFFVNTQILYVEYYQVCFFPLSSAFFSLLLVSLLLFSSFTPNTMPPSCVNKLACLLLLLFSPCTMYTPCIPSDLRWAFFFTFLTSLKFHLTLLDLMKFGMHVSIWEPFPSFFALQKTFYILFYIFLSLLLCGNPSKKSDKMLILSKYHMIYLLFLWWWASVFSLFFFF